MAIQYSLTQRTSAMSALNSGIGAAAVVKLFSGAAPANCGTADSGTMLVQFAGNATQFGTVSGAVLTASAVAGVTATASGTPAYFRIYPSAATTINAVTQGTVGTTGTDMILTAATVTAGQTVNFTSLTVTAFGV